jgi:hypothetical protein
MSHRTARLSARVVFAPACALWSFSGRRRDQLDRETLSTRTVEAVHVTPHPAHMSLWLRPIGGAL